MEKHAHVDTVTYDYTDIFMSNIQYFAKRTGITLEKIESDLGLRMGYFQTILEEESKFHYKLHISVDVVVLFAEKFIYVPENHTKIRTIRDLVNPIVRDEMELSVLVRQIDELNDKKDALRAKIEEEKFTTEDTNDIWGLRE